MTEEEFEEYENRKNPIKKTWLFLETNKIGVRFSPYP